VTGKTVATGRRQFILVLLETAHHTPATWFDVLAELLDVRPARLGFLLNAILVFRNLLSAGRTEGVVLLFNALPVVPVSGLGVPAEFLDFGTAGLAARRYCTVLLRDRQERRGE